MYVMGEEEVHRIIFPLRRSGNGETPLYLAVQAAAERFPTRKCEMFIGVEMEFRNVTTNFNDQSPGPGFPRSWRIWRCIKLFGKGLS